MAGLTSRAFRGGLSALWFSGVASALRPVTAGRGAILMLHRVQPASSGPFSPNAVLSITPQYLSDLLASFGEAGVDVVTLDEALQRVAAPAAARRFVVFTFDDGYRDNLEHALPVFQRYAAPFTVYATSSFVDRSFAPWWYVLEQVIAGAARVRWRDERTETVYGTRDADAKHRAYAALSHAFFQLPIAELRQQLQRLAEDHDLSLPEFAARELCGFRELRELQAGGAAIGCHTVSHPRLLLETPETVRYELSDARRQLEAGLGRPVRHLAYPYGKRDHVTEREFAIARELGFATATTTRKGALFSAHAQHLQAWPRVEVTPSFAGSPRYLHTILSGLPLVLWNRGRHAIVD
jgi:peptidoglycan/xylan/chitin deacetylase (PgdA/CDA1 family)